MPESLVNSEAAQAYDETPKTVVLKDSECIVDREAFLLRLSTIFGQLAESKKMADETHDALKHQFLQNVDSITSSLQHFITDEQSNANKNALRTKISTSMEVMLKTPIRFNMKKAESLSRLISDTTEKLKLSLKRMDIEFVEDSKS